MKFFFLCPIPEEQKPINQYLQFKDNVELALSLRYSFLLRFNFFFQKLDLFKSFEDLDPIIKNRSMLFSFSNLFFLVFFSCVFLSKFCTFFFKLVWTLFFFFAFLSFLFFQEFSECNKNLQKSSFLYEEGSWYEIQRWEKPFPCMKNDRFLNTQRIQGKQKQLFLFFLIFF